MGDALREAGGGGERGGRAHEMRWAGGGKAKKGLLQRSHPHYSPENAFSDSPWQT